MLIKCRQWIIFFAFMVITTAQAGIEVRNFTSDKQEALYDQLMYELRCLVCQNENLAASNAELAKDLRDEVYIMITEQQLGEVEIKKFLIDRYGDYVLYKPPLKKSTWLLWFGPFIMLFLGGVFIFFFVRSSRSCGNAEEDSDITQDERAEMKVLLEEAKK